MNSKILTILLAIIFIASILRLYKLAQNPPSLYWDEVSLGYNAYSILKTGKDEHGEIFPPARFIAFGDFKPPGYIYASVPSIALFGLTEFAIRFPSSVSGILFGLVSYLLTKQLFRNNKIALLSSFLVTISPWSLQISRGAFEAHLASLFNTLAVLFILKFRKNKGQYLLASFIFFIFSFYTFNANRIIAPLLLTCLAIFKIKDIMDEKKWLTISILTSIILLFPSFSYLNSRESRVRFQEVSIFNNLEIIKKSNQRIEQDNNIIARFIHNRRLSYAKEFLKHYFDHFKADYLFISGDNNPRLSSQAVGELYILSLPFLILGIIFTIKNFGRNSVPLFLWLTIAIIPSAVSKETPHALRTASVLPIYEIFSAYGLWYLIFKLSSIKYFLSVVLSILLFLNFFYYLHFYYSHYPLDWFGEWQYGYKEAVLTAQQVANQYDHILVTEALGRPYIYFLFYNKVNPEEYRLTKDANRDWFGFWTVSGFGKYKFGLDQLTNLDGKILFIGTEQETDSYFNVIKTVYSPGGKIIFRLVDL